MAQEGFKRKLTAILSADVVGYSRLMRDDEEATVRNLAAHRVLITGIIQQHHGRMVIVEIYHLLSHVFDIISPKKGDLDL